jgi:lipopolysaccharide/colanic/teichoic acid biosynthesis glycosyltransferase
MPAGPVSLASSLGEEGVISLLRETLTGDQQVIVRLTTGAGERSYEAAKRVFDVVFASIVLVLTAPLIAAAAVAIRLDSPGPAFFRQLRLGRNGQQYYLLKLRGMYVDSKERYPELYDYTAATRETRSALYFHQGGDPRVTRVGRWLRKHSIDELPNFWNVLRGEMSVVGPRPEIPELAPLYGDELNRMLSVKPGVTSPAKALGRDKLSFSETLSLELAYIEARSLSLDLRTILWTARSVIRGHGVKS